tara:strand:- start:1585 stop:2127 length:543 start_codon:yes stop_codon:yes gene_type:complete
MNPDQIMSLIGAYNSDPRSFTDEEAEMIAMLSAQSGIRFRREFKPVSKGLYNMADIGLLGMLPNEYEPWSRGQSVYGETTGEKIGSGIGTVAGLPLAVLSGLGLAGGAIGLGKRAMGYARGKRGVDEGNLLQLTSGSGGRYGRAAARNRWTPTAGSGAPIRLPAGRQPYPDFNLGYGAMI